MRLRLPSALPPLRGPAWWLFLAVWATVLGFALYGTGLYLAERKFEPTPNVRYGLALDGVGAVRGTFGREADASGIRPGDRIVAVDGIGTSDVSEVRRLLVEKGIPPTITLSMRSPSGQERAYRLTNSPQHLRDGEALIGLSFVNALRVKAGIFIFSMLLAPIALATLLLLRRARDPLAPWVSLTALMMALGMGPPLSTSAAGGSGALAWALEIALPLAGWMQTAVLALFPDARFVPRWTWAVVIGALPLTWWMRVSGESVDFNVAALIGQLAAVVVVSARYRAMPIGPGRQQIRWTLFGFAASLVALALLIAEQRLLSTSTSLVVRVYADIADDLLNGCANILLLAAMTLGLMRYRLYDAEATISRSVAYGALTLGLLAVFAASEKLIELMGEEYFGERLGALAGGIGAAMAAVLIVPMHHRVTHWAERRFRSALARLRHGLPLLVGDLRETASPAALADAMLTRVEAGVRARHGAVILGSAVLDVNDIDEGAVRGWLDAATLPTKGDRLNIDRADPLFPLRVPLAADGAGLVGWLLLGPRPDGSFYGKEERDALLDIAEPVARALAVAAARERREAEQAAELDRLRALLDRVAKHVGLTGLKHRSAAKPGAASPRAG